MHSLNGIQILTLKSSVSKSPKAKRLRDPFARNCDGSASTEVYFSYDDALFIFVFKSSTLSGDPSAVVIVSSKPKIRERQPLLVILCVCRFSRFSHSSLCLNTPFPPFNRGFVTFQSILSNVTLLIALNHNLISAIILDGLGSRQCWIYITLNKNMYAINPCFILILRRILQL